MIPDFVQEVIDDYRDVSIHEWVVNDFEKDMYVSSHYPNEDTGFSTEFMEWYVVSKNKKVFDKELAKEC